MRKNLFKRITSIIAAFVMCVGVMQPHAFAMAEKPYAVGNNGKVSFYNLDQLQDEESVTHKFIDKNGNEASISIKRVSGAARTAGSWLVSIDTTTIDAEYYVDLVNNRIVMARDWGVYTIGYDYSDVQLEYSASYSRLSFKVSLQGVVSGTCWLKATPRGYNNQVDVSYSA